MKFVVISDVHGRADLVDKLIGMHRDRDGVFFLGDGIRDLSLERITEGGKLFCGVRGNCDPHYINVGEWDLGEELLLAPCEYTVIMMHGHTHSVKSGEERAVAYASRRGADILLYGHTHVPTERYYPEGYEIDGYILPKAVWVMNPGSLACGSYGLLQIKNGQILMSHGKI